MGKQHAGGGWIPRGGFGEEFQLRCSVWQQTQANLRVSASSEQPRQSVRSRQKKRRMKSQRLRRSGLELEFASGSFPTCIFSSFLCSDRTSR